MPLDYNSIFNHCLDLAEEAYPFTLRNPMVGCSIYNKKNEWISEGVHKIYGQAHAEINALNSIKNNEELEGATIFVSLEPCAHQGLTPSCAQTLAQLPIGKLVYLTKDPNPLVSGRGEKILKKSGIKVEHYKNQILENKNYLLNHKFFKSVVSDGAYVHLKVALSKDRFINQDGATVQISSLEASQEMHKNRAGCEAVLIGVNTLLKDNPKLNVRHPGFSSQNKVVVLDPSLKSLEIINNSNLLKVREAKNTYIFYDKALKSKYSSILKKSDVRWISVSFSKDKAFDLHNLLRILKQNLDIHSVFVEGGYETHKKFIEAGLYERVDIIDSQTQLLKSGLKWDLKSKLKEATLTKRLKVGTDIFNSHFY